VENGIILLDFTRLRMRDEVWTGGRDQRGGARPAATDPDDNVVHAIRPVPLALGLGAGSELQRPLALAVIGRLILSTPITLFAYRRCSLQSEGPTTGCGDRPRDGCLKEQTTTPHPGAEIMRLLPTITLVAAAVVRRRQSRRPRSSEPATFQTASCPKRRSARIQLARSR